MKPWDTLVQLARFDTQPQVLATLDADDAFWVGAKYALNHFIGVPVSLRMGNPVRYGAGLPPAVFERLMQAILANRLSPDDLAAAIEQISAACTEDEWTRWYRPILSGQLEIRVPTAVFNQHCPASHRIPEFRPAALPLVESNTIPDHVYVEPVYEGRRSIWVATPRGKSATVRGYDLDGFRIEAPQVEKALARISLQRLIGLVFEGYYTDESLYLRDVITLDQFRDQQPTPAFSTRRSSLENLHHTVYRKTPEVMLASAEPASAETLSMAFEQGFDAVVLRDSQAGYAFEPGADHLVRPDQIATLTLRDVTTGMDGTKYAGVAKELIADGTVDDHAVRASVFLGLKRSAREIAWNHRGRLIGTEFVVDHCGVDADGVLLFPVFKGWRDQ